MDTKRKALIWAVVSAVILTFFTWLLIRDIGLPDGRPLTTLSPKGTKAQNIQNLIIPVFLIAGVVFIAVEVGIIWLAARYARKDTDIDGVDEPEQVHGNSKLEIGWTLAPALMLAVLAVFNVQTILAMDDAEDPLEIYVIGQQWWWEYRYDLDDDGTPDIITANEAAIPVGRDVIFKIQSNDVVHSFWIPALAGKLDAVPGRTHDLVVDATEPGVFEGQCTEFCGLSHGVMRMQVKALEPAEYDVWVEAMTSVTEQPAEDDEQAIAGQALFISQCAMCHQIDGITPSSTAPFEYTNVPDPHYGETVDAPVAARNAPNLTKFMMRDTFVGGLLPLYENKDAAVEAIPTGDPAVNSIKRWLRDPEEVKPMDPANNQGMPNYNLSEEQIEQLTAFLLTLK